LTSLSFDDRKMFMILFNYYVLNVPVTMALKIASKEDYLEKRVPLLEDEDAYDARLGLKVAMEDDIQIW
jgi:hypothetical protein